MKQINIEPTKYSPKVHLNPEGEMFIQGRSILEDPFPFYNPIMNWIANCTAKKFMVEVRLEYINTSNSKLILNILKSVKEKYLMNDISIKWFYEVDDEDMLDLGQDYEALLKVPFDFFEYSDDES